jgi:hypothetical protein
VDLIRRTYRNRLSAQYERERDTAESIAYVVASGPGETFDHLAASGEPLIYVVTEIGELVIGAQLSWPTPASHAVLAQGRAVAAAGEVLMAVADGIKIVLALNNKSGHYEPDAGCLVVAAQAFRDLGFEVPEVVVQAHGRED